MISVGRKTNFHFNYHINIGERIFGSYAQNFNSYRKNKGLGFEFNNIEYIHHSTLPINESVFHRLTNTQKTFFILLLFSFMGFLFLNFYHFLLYLTALLSVIYFLDIFFNLLVIGNGALVKPEIKISKKELLKLSDKSLPAYTILCPLYKESKVITQFMKAMREMNYPKNKLQILIILERDDKETIKAVRQTNLPSYFKVVIMPDSLPKTKPKALNFGMKYATGDFIVIYDAEDIPDRDQLRKAIIAFRKSSNKTVCVQAKLNFYNSKQNILTRLFTAEYSLLYELILPGLQSINAPIPLGGTSNHFRADVLKSLNKWDSFNVTEDCDLGMRLFKKGYLTAIVDSTTYEEANSEIKNWLNQRVRWQKGYLLSYLVNLRHPWDFYKNNYRIHFLTFNYILGGKTFALLMNPIMWTFLLIYFSFEFFFNITLNGMYFPEIKLISMITLFFGYVFYIIYYIFGLVKSGKSRLIPFAVFIPIYWTLMSISAYLAIYEAYKRPHAWSKTTHGLHLENKDKNTSRFALPALGILNSN